MSFGAEKIENVLYTGGRIPAAKQSQNMPSRDSAIKGIR